jgi:CheY-like chemotaxis protein
MTVLHCERHDLLSERAALLSRSDDLLEGRRVLLAEMREFTEAARLRTRETSPLLIVEDEATEVLDFADCAKSHGFKVVATARDAKGAREAIARSRPDAAIVGVHLADGRTGVALANELTLLGGNTALEISVRTIARAPLSGCCRCAIGTGCTHERDQQFRASDQS